MFDKFVWYIVSDVGIVFGIFFVVGLKGFLVCVCGSLFVWYLDLCFFVDYISGINVIFKIV